MSLSTFAWSWAAAGALGCVIVYFLHRRSRNNDLRPSPGLLAGTLVAGPIVPVFVLGLTVFSSRKRPSSRPEPPTGPVRDRDDLMCRMINLRLAVAPEPGRPSSADHWPMYQFSETPEADLAAAVDMFLWNEDAVHPLVPDSGGALVEVLQLRSEMREKVLAYCSAAMKLKHPQYLQLGHNIFERSVDLAIEWALNEIGRAVRDRPYPPPSWWTEQLSWQVVMNGDFGSSVNVHELEHGTSRLSVQWRTMMSRRSESDEIWSFQSPPETWQRLGGRAGLVLVRRGRPVSSVTLRMN